MDSPVIQTVSKHLLSLSVVTKIIFHSRHLVCLMLTFNPPVIDLPSAVGCRSRRRDERHPEKDLLPDPLTVDSEK